MAPATTPGTVLGTVGYMAPEQVRGEPADHRSDIFALGCVLYEMLTGARAYQRETAAETMSAILREDPPDPSTLNVTVPPGVLRALRRCLEKRPQERFESARDLAFALESAVDSSSASSARGVAATPRSAMAGWRRRGRDPRRCSRLHRRARHRPTIGRIRHARCRPSFAA